SMQGKCGFAVLSCAMVLALANFSPGFVIGDWENNSSDQWIDWGTQSGYNGGATSLPSPKYQFSSTGATLGSSSLLLTQSGYNQDLPVNLEYISGGMTAFFANNAFSIDVTLPPTASGGFSQFYEVALNAPGWGFKALTPNPVPQAQWGWGASGGPQQTNTVVIDYSSALASIPSNAGYAEFIISTNNDGAAHNQFFLDNAQLINPLPEPGMATMLIVGALAVVRRSRR